MPDPAGYSGTPLLHKLGIKPGQTVFLDRLPDGLELDGLLSRTDLRVVQRLPRHVDVTLTFHDQAATLERRFDDLVPRTELAGMIWVCWPKRSSGVPTDLGEGLVREIGLAGGMVGVKIAAIDATWSGLKFVRRLRDR